MPERPRMAASDPVEFADYVAALSSELSTLARRHGLDALGFILEMARLEAENAATKLNGSGGAHVGD
jgi:hypothetical protein